MPFFPSLPPFPRAQVLKYTAGEINYGGRVTDEWDRRCLLSVLEDFYCPAVLEEDYAYSESGVYRQIETNVDIKVGGAALIRSCGVCRSASEI